MDNRIAPPGKSFFGARPPLRQMSRAIRASTTTKLLLAISLALLPMGIIAFIVALDNYRFAHEKQADLADATLTTIADRIDRIFDRDVLVLRTIIPLADDPRVPGGACTAQLEFIAEEENSIDAAAIIDRNGRLRCHAGAIATPASIDRLARAARDRPGSPVLLIGSEGELLLAIASRNDDLIPAARIDIEILRQAVAQGLPVADAAVTLTTGGKSIELSQHSLVLVEDTSIQRRLDSGLATISIDAPSARLQTSTALIALLPFLMWLAALVISAAVLHHLVTVPLARIGQVLRIYTAGDHNIRLSGSQTPTSEMAQFATTFDRLADAVEAHDHEMGQAVELQKMLTREVHHRVKNNLQIISSLISISSRESKNSRVTDAYQQIQRRVDALSLVHRHHFADDNSAGIDLRALLSELLRSLQVSYDGRRHDLSFQLDIDSGWVTQDVAVPIAFLITETTSMLADAAKKDVEIGVTLRRVDDHDCILEIRSAVLVNNDMFGTNASSALARIVQGMVRKLQRPLEFIAPEGAYRIAIRANSRHSETG